jgi:NADH-quinone oxidoreductase subunit J
MEFLNLNVIVFYLAAGLAIGAAFLMVWQKNPVASALYMILSIVSQAVLYLQLDALFVGALLIIVYAGAIVTLFLFVIMMLNLRGEDLVEPGKGPKRYAKLIVSGIVGAELVYLIAQTSGGGLKFAKLDAAMANFGDVKPVAELLYSKYLYGFEITSILLLVAIVGAVILARRESGEN